MELETLQYPIGWFHWEIENGAQPRESWLAAIAETPAGVRHALRTRHHVAQVQALRARNGRRTPGPRPTPSSASPFSGGITGRREQRGRPHTKVNRPGDGI